MNTVAQGIVAANDRFTEVLLRFRCNLDGRMQAIDRHGTMMPTVWVQSESGKFIVNVITAGEFLINRPTELGVYLSIYNKGYCDALAENCGEKAAVDFMLKGGAR